jgi:hypothetical protein
MSAMLWQALLHWPGVSVLENRSGAAPHLHLSAVLRGLSPLEHPLCLRPTGRSPEPSRGGRYPGEFSGLADLFFRFSTE